MKEIIIDKNNSNQRLDKYLLKYLNTASKAFIYKMFRKKNIKLNDKKVSGSEIINAGDKLVLYLSDETIDKFQKEKVLAKSDKPNLDIIYEDQNILIINKPIGMLSHPESSKDKNTLTDNLLFYLYEKGEYSNDKSSTFTPSICNRLDRNTSGIVVGGKNLLAIQELNKMFKENKTSKYYLTLVKGKIQEKKILKGYHTKNNTTNLVEIKRTPTKDSKEVITEIEPIKFNDDYTLLRIKLVTGKSHQIRAHLKSINHPIAGDRKYGDKDTNDYFRKNYHIDKQLLHAEKIIFEANEGELKYLNNKEFTAPLQKDFKKIIDSIFMD